MHSPRSFGAFGVTMVLGLFGASGVVQKCAPPPPPPPVSAPSDISTQCNALVTVARAGAGLAPLNIVGSLNSAAEQHSTDQATRRKMTHTGSDGSTAGQRMTRNGYTWSTWGENVAAGQSDCASVIGAWLNSPPHRANILSSAIIDIGIGAVAASDGTIYWTMDLAAPG